jgi:predicted house-cleaning noncanonical NTP pyrophosphatase (MazG superfamily)
VTAPGKLVRDKIPAIIRAAGEHPVTRAAGPGEHRALLRDKLAEETAEYLASADDSGELADILEVVYALAARAGITRRELNRLRRAKRRRRGGLDAGIVWMRVLSLSRSVIYEQIRAGRLRTVHQGRACLITAAAITDYITLLEAESQTERAA